MHLPYYLYLLKLDSPFLAAKDIITLPKQLTDSTILNRDFLFQGSATVYIINRLN